MIFLLLTHSLNFLTNNVFKFFSIYSSISTDSRKLLCPLVFLYSKQYGVSRNLFICPLICKFIQEYIQCLALCPILVLLEEWNKQSDREEYRELWEQGKVPLSVCRTVSTLWRQWQVNTWASNVERGRCTMTVQGRSTGAGPKRQEIYTVLFSAAVV